MTSSPTPSTLLEASVALPEPAEWALQLAAQAWCEPTTSDRVMDAELATVFAQQLTRLAASYEASRPAQALAPASSVVPELVSALQGVIRVADRATDEFDAARAAIAGAHEANVRAELARSAQAVPDGFVLMSKAMTTKQRLAMAKADGETGDRYRNMARAFVAAAAPTALPAVTPQVADEGQEPVAFGCAGDQGIRQTPTTTAGKGHATNRCAAWCGDATKCPAVGVGKPLPPASSIFFRRELSCECKGASDYCYHCGKEPTGKGPCSYLKRMYDDMVRTGRIAPFPESETTSSPHPTSPLWDSKGNPIHANIDALREQQRLAATPPLMAAVPATPQGQEAVSELVAKAKWPFNSRYGEDWKEDATPPASVPAQTGEWLKRKLTEGGDIDTMGAAQFPQTREVARLAEEAKNTAGEYGIAKQRNNEFDNSIGVNRTRKDLFAAIDALAALAHSPTVASPAETPDAFHAFRALRSLVEALLTRADSDYLRRQIDAAITMMSDYDYSPPVPWPDESFGIAVWGASPALVAEVGGLEQLAAKIEGNHIISGGNGPNFSAGWSMANKVSAKMIREFAALAASPVVIAGEVKHD